MRIIWGEIKKIWNWKILAIIGVVCAMYYMIFMSYEVEYYRVGNHPQAENIYYTEELVRLYGTSITADELSEYIATEREALLLQAEDYIRTMPVFAQAGIYTYTDYEAMRTDLWEREATQAESNARQALMGEECGYLGFRFQELDFLESISGLWLKASYIDDPDSFWSGLNDREQKRYRELIQSGEHYAIMSYSTYTNTSDYARKFAILLMLSVLILVSPLVVSDRHANLHHLQYSSKLGRKIMNRQLVATLLSAFMLTTLLVLVFGGIYSANGTYIFWDANINSEFNVGHYSVFSLTYGQWVIALVILMYTLALAISMFAFILSRFSRNLITLVMKLIPVFAAAAFLCVAVFDDLFSMLSNALYQLLHVFGTEIYVCGAVVVIALAAVWFVVRREKRVDVV